MAVFFFFFFVQQFNAGHLSLAYAISTRHKRTASALCVGVGIRNVINSLFAYFWSNTEFQEFTRVLRLSCKKKKKTRSLSLTRFLHGRLRPPVNYVTVIGQNKQINHINRFFFGEFSELINFLNLISNWFLLFLSKLHRLDLTRLALWQTLPCIIWWKYHS